MAILDYTIDELKAEVARREAATKHESARARGAAHAATVPPIGRWRVTTEGYCEGNTSDLGVHEGHVADIAIRLSGLANRGLTFIPEPTTTPPLPPPIDRVSVAVILPGDSSPLPDDMVAYMRAYLAAQPYTTTCQVEASPYYASVTIKRPKP